MRTTLSIVFMWVMGLILVLTIWGCGTEDKRNEECALRGCSQADRNERNNKNEPTVVYKQGPSGQDGANCYDDIGDVNGDGEIDTLDCQGQAGTNGQNGVDGQSCEVTQVSNGAIIECGSSQAVVLNGKDGISPVVKAIPFCEKPDYDWPEVALKMSDGSLVAFFTDGKNLMNSRLVVLTSGWYQSTDSQHCLFYVDENNNIEHK